jgi:excinuclease ABC subunit C
LKAHDNRISRLVSEIREIDYLETPTVIEALILESELIKKYEPKFNIKDKDNKSFLYVVITKEAYPRVLLVRGTELERMKSTRVFGPFVSASSIRAALAILRRIFPWNNHLPGEIGKAKRPCFNYQIGLCPGTCVGVISKRDYARTIKNLILFFSGEKVQIIKNLKLELNKLSDKQKFDAAAKVRDMIFNLEHIYDTALITKDVEAPSPAEKGINIFGRIEGYDISNISGYSAVGSMVVFVNGIPEKSEYRKFKIKTVSAANDVGMLREVLARRFQNKWTKPDIILIDGGWGQVNVAGEILREFNLKIPVLGIAKGITRKKDELIFGRENLELGRLAGQYKDIFVAIRDEAHRFAIRYHRKLRGKLN